MSTNQVLSSPIQPASAPQILVEVDWNAPEEEVYEHFMAFFRFLLSSPDAHKYNFLIDATEFDIAMADEVTTGAFMQALMEQDSPNQQSDQPDVSIRLLDRAEEEDGMLAAGLPLINISHRQTYLDLASAQIPELPIEFPWVTHVIHGYELAFPPSHSLPYILQQWPYYSSNLGRIAHGVHQKYSDLKFIDVGANVGDSVAIVRRLSHFPILCIEGDGVFLNVLHRNIQQFDEVFLAPYYVGENDVSVQAQSSGQGGTAHLVCSEQGAHEGFSAVNIRKLSSVLHDYETFSQPKMLKIDTDGFDGKILRGARDILASAKPVVFFEYDPSFLTQQNDSWRPIFSCLSEHGYSGLIIYDNFGDLLLCLPTIEFDRLEELNSYFSGRESLQYCDVCAFHGEDHDLFERIRSSELAFFQTIRG
jgi:FkbM family methyltransferase